MAMAFLSAVKRSAGIDKDLLTFRKEVGDYMIENIERYINFCTSQNPGHQYIEEQFLQDIQQL